MDWESHSARCETMASEASFSRSVNRQRPPREMLLIQDKKMILSSSLERARASLSPLDFAKLCDITNKELREWLEATRRNKLLHNQTTSTLASSRQCASVVSLNSSVYNPASQYLVRGTQLTNTSRSNRLAYRPSQFRNQLNTIDENREDTEENEDTVEYIDTEENEDIEESDGVAVDSSSSCSKGSSSSEVDDGEVVPTSLTEWHFLLDNESLNIVGKTPNNSVVTAKNVKIYKVTGEIETESGMFVVEGKPKVVESVPKFVYNACRLGFPKKWRSLLKKWIEEVSDEQNASKDKKKAKTSEKKPTKPKNKKEANTSEKKPSKPKKNEGNSTDQPTGSAQKGSKKEKSTAGNANKENIDSPKTVSVAKKKKPEANKSQSGTSKTTKKEAQQSPMTKEASKNTNYKKRKMPDSAPKLSSSKAEQESKTKKTSKNENRGEAPKNSKRKKPDQRPTPGGEPYDVFADIGDAMDYEDVQCMTPNRMLDELSSTGIGAFTPPMESVNFLFASGGRQESIPTSPASSNIERNPVSDRMAKQIERKK